MSEDLSSSEACCPCGVHFPQEVILLQTARSPSLKLWSVLHSEEDGGSCAAWSSVVAVRAVPGVIDTDRTAYPYRPELDDYYDCMCDRTITFLACRGYAAAVQKCVKKYELSSVRSLRKRSPRYSARQACGNWTYQPVVLSHPSSSVVHRRLPLTLRRNFFLSRSYSCLSLGHKKRTTHALRLARWLSLTRWSCDTARKFLTTHLSGEDN